MFQKRLFRSLVYLLLSCILFVNLVGCTTNVGTDITSPTPNEIVGKEMDEKFKNASMNFAIELFKKSNDTTENTLISPLSITFALAMVTNGANNNTLSQLENVLGKDISIDELNEYLYTYLKNLPSSEQAKFHLANSIWFKDTEGFKVEEEFLQKNADYYNAALYKEPFNDKTVGKINRWVKDNTMNMIKEIIKNLDPETMVVLLNALAIDAKWDVPYDLEDIHKAQFHNFMGKEIEVDMMYSTENIYLEDENTTGFIKNYAENSYSFVALLPAENVDIQTYVSQLTADTVMKLLNNKQETTVSAALPKFSYEFEIKMNDVLFNMGIVDAFDENTADFSKMSTTPLAISKVIHRTFIQVDELGTKAGAVTAVIVDSASAIIDEKIVTLDRPFVYMIIDQKTNLPIFIGTVIDFKN